ncbi:MAG: DinB family protein [Phycisphaerales bacterium]|jgi:hypothetical protein|nr:DinB family protein [Planctomycetota bacterium]
MSTTAIDPFALAIAACGDATVGYAGAILEPIPAESFAHLPHADVNHPAFVVGHLGIYLNKSLELVGRSDLCVAPPFEIPTFEDGAPCVEQDGRYPGKDVLLPYFLEHSKTVLDAVRATSTETFAADNPMEGRMKEMFPTVGVAVNFLVNNHVMMHLGQISTWRRLMGLGSAM